MSVKNCLGVAAIVVVMTLVLSTSASAGIVIGFGAPGSTDGGNSMPFGETNWEPEYQQVYAASDFSSPITITEISFYDHNVPGGAVNTGKYQISLSTTSVGVNKLNGNDLSANMGSDNEIVFSGLLPSLTPGPGGQLNIFFSEPFTYNPADGNLLLDVVSTDAQPGYVYFDTLGNFQALTSRTWTDGGDYPGTTSGLITGFDVVAAVPEPSAWLLMLVGVGGIGAAVRMSRRTRVAATA